MKMDQAYAIRLLSNQLRSKGHCQIATSLDLGGMSQSAVAVVEAIREAHGHPSARRHARDYLIAALRRHGMHGVGFDPTLPTSPMLSAGLTVIRAVRRYSVLEPASSTDIARPTAAVRGSMDRMVLLKATLLVKNESGVADLERVVGEIAAMPRRESLTLKMSGAPQRAMLRDMWLSMVVGAAFHAARDVQVIAPGLTGWPDLDAVGFQEDETAALSLPYLLALQRDARILPENAPDSPLDAAWVRRHASQRRGGLLGVGGKVRRLVEFDPHEPVAPVLGRRDNRGAALEQLILTMMSKFEIGATARGISPVAQGMRRHVIDFLRELHSNAYRYARRNQGVRMLGFRKHLYTASVARQRAEQFPALRSFVDAQGDGIINLVEATISDFGPGILGGFRASDAGPAFAHCPDDQLIRTLLHKQLSGNLDDPNAGLGILIALDAASRIGAFVTLRTGAHWFVLDATTQAGAEMQAIPGEHPVVQGTHWAILYPDSPLG